MHVLDTKNPKDLLPYRSQILAEMRRRDGVVELLPPEPERELKIAAVPAYGRALICAEGGEFRGALVVRRLRWESEVFEMEMGVVRAILTPGGGPEAARARGALIDAAVRPDAVAYLLLPVLEGDDASVDFGGDGPASARLTNMVNLRHALEAPPEAPPPAGVKIRPFEKKDAETVERISAAAFVHDRYTVDTALPRDRVEAAHRGWARECCRFCDLVLAAECDRIVVGFCAVSLHPGDARQAIVQLIAVDRQRRRKGVGKGLLGAALGRLRGRAESAVIRTEQANAPALSLYAAMGFVPYARFEYLRFYNF